MGLIKINDNTSIFLGSKPRTPLDIEIGKIILDSFGIDDSKNVPMPKKYIINHGATVLIWDNGEKTVVKRCKDDEFNKRLGFLTAFFQHYCRNE